MPFVQAPSRIPSWCATRPSIRFSCLPTLTLAEDTRQMRQRNQPDRPESFADRPVGSPPPDVLSTALRAVRLAGRAINETEASSGEVQEHAALFGALHMVESG